MMTVTVIPGPATASAPCPPVTCPGQWTQLEDSDAAAAAVRKTRKMNLNRTTRTTTSTRFVEVGAPKKVALSNKGATINICDTSLPNFTDCPPDSWLWALVAR